MNAELSEPKASAVLIETLKAFHDVRGSVFEPLKEAQISGQKNVHVVLSEPNAVRGNHSHATAIEVTTVVGPCQIRLKEQGGLRDLDVPPGEVWRLTIPPGVVHAFRNTGTATMVLVSFSTETHEVSAAHTLREQIL
jgi:dTDP-4-dehydrorhamnose 3,5-epimerase-like enzyme